MRAQAACPKRVVFVLKETQPERWISNGGDFYAYLKPPGVEEVMEKVCLLLSSVHSHFLVFVALHQLTCEANVIDARSHLLYHSRCRVNKHRMCIIVQMQSAH